MPAPLSRLRSALETDFVFERELGSGGFGLLWLAREKALNRPVVIKAMRDDQLSPAVAARFLREAELLARMNDSRVVRVYRAGELAGIPYCVMEHLDGPNLSERLTRGPLRPEELRRLGGDLLRGLAALHATGIVHRDLKPANILWLPDRAVLIDLGLARATHVERGDTTADGAQLGTPGYQAPEQFCHPDVGPAADLYAAAAVLYEAATGRPWNGMPDPRAGNWRGVDWGLRRVLARALAWSPSRRWRDAGSFRRALERARLLVQVRRMGGVAFLVWLGSSLFALPSSPSPGRSPDLVLGPFTGCRGEDSTAAALRAFVFRHLDWYSGWQVRDSRIEAPWRLSASIECGPDPVALLALQDSTGVVAHRFAVPIAQDPLGAAPAVADSIVARLWPRQLGEFRNLGGPARHPGTATRHFFRGEEAFARDDWRVAEASYLAALQVDPAFQLARWRLLLVRQWRRVPFEEELEALLRAPGDLPPQLLALLQVAAIPDIRERIARYARIAAAHPRDSYAALSHANEVFVRGPLVGIPLDSGLALMREVEARDPTRNVAPALDHQAWGAIRLGQRTLARVAVERRTRLPNTGGLGDFFRLAYWERFHPAVAPTLRWWAFRETSPEDLRLIGRVHRLALTFDLPDAQAALADLLLSRTEVRPVRAGAFEGLGIARMAAARVAEAFAAFDSAAMYHGSGGGSRASVWCVATGVLGYHVVPEPEARACESILRATPLDDRRAWENWAVAAMAAGSRGESRDLDQWLARYDSLPEVEGTRRWGLLLRAERQALGGNWKEALDLSEAAVMYDSAGAIGGAFLRSAVHLRRAAWWEAAGDLERAAAELEWSDNTDLRGWPSGRAQAGEVDAVFSGVARLHRARLALARGDTSRCPMVERVEQLWSRADHPARLRAMLDPLLRHCQ